MTKAERYAEYCKNFLGAPNVQLDDRWTVNVTADGGLQFRQDKISKGKMSPVATVKLFEFIEENHIKQIDYTMKKEEKRARKGIK